MPVKIFAILSLCAALISAACAFLSWLFSVELSRPVISFYVEKVKEERVSRDNFRVSFNYLFKNVGKDTANVSEIAIGYTTLQATGFRTVTKKRMLNPLPVGQVYLHGSRINIPINPNLSDNELKEQLPTLAGKHVIIMTLKYKGTSIFAKKTKVKFYSVYHGTEVLSHLTEEEYRQVEHKLPKDFRLDL